MRNIELKIRVNNFREIQKILKLINAQFCDNLNQKDTYFNSQKGRLKIREVNNINFELIYYHRPNKSGLKISNYSRISLTKIQFKKLKSILVSSLGIKVVIFKKRKLWLFKNTRIHLDKVRSLGNFLELETVLKKIKRNDGEKEYLKIYNLLKLEKYKKVEKSYSDLFIINLKNYENFCL